MDLKKQHMEACDAHWDEIMKEARANGFVLQAYGGVATLVSHRSQMEDGVARYRLTQKMNGHCPKDFGYEGCIDEKTNEVMHCGSCCLVKKGTDRK